MIKEGIRVKLNSTSIVTDDLATYEFTTDEPETPAIFTTAVIPNDTEYPAMIINQPTTTDFGCRDQRGGEILNDIRVYEDKDRNDEVLSRLADNIWRALNRATIDASGEGFNAFAIWCDPPIEIEDPDGFPGYLIRTRALVLEN